MAGRVIRVVPRMTVDFSKVNTGNATSFLARRIDVSQFREVMLYVRLHSGTNLATPTSFALTAYYDGYTDEDPGAVNGTLPAFLTVIGTALELKAGVANVLYPYQIAPTAPATAIGGLIALAITCNQVGASVNAVAVISVDLSGKE